MAQDLERWQSRPVLAGILRVFITLAPIAISVVLVTIVSRQISRPEGLLNAVLWWIALSVFATAALLVLDKLFRKFTPVVALFKLSLVFPDSAPSRFKSALRAGTVRQLQRRVESGELSDATPQEAAEQLIGLASTLNAHDRLTRGHTERVRAYSVMIGEEMGLDDKELELLNWSGLVHDIGKLAVPSEILNKDGAPTAEEWEILRDHPARAFELVKPLRPWLGEWADSATQHHERFDGKGYPNGVAGRDISRAGRIVAVADAYDVMTSVRSYKKAMPTAEARQELALNAGTQFDPEVVRAFLGIAIGRLRIVAGPLASITQLPAGGASLGSAAATGASAVTTMAVAALTGLLSPEIAEIPPPAPPAAVAMVMEAGDISMDGQEDSGPLTVDLASVGFEVGATVEVLADSENGTFELSENGLVTFTPEQDYHGTVVAPYRICNAEGSCDEATITFLVDSVNDVPIAVADELRFDEDGRGAVDVLLNDLDADGDTLELISVVVRDAEGLEKLPDVLEVVGRRVVVELPPDANGSFVLEYTTEDAAGATANGSVRVEVVAVNDAPVAEDDLATVIENTATTIRVLDNDVDVDGDSLSITSVKEVTGGDAVISGTTVLFTPAPRYIGSGGFTYEVSDGNGEVATAEVVVQVQDDPDRPKLVVDNRTLLEDQSLVVAVLSNDTSASSLDPDTLEVVTPPRNGTTTVAGDGSIAYKATPNWFGADSFEYFVCDVDDYCDRAWATFTVTPVNDPPAIVAGTGPIVLEDSGQFTATNWASVLNPGPYGEADQTLSISVVAADPTLFSSPPTLSTSGDLAFTTAPNANGSTTL
ncbi:MAG: Ig-like domain-containing protein, partial [Acidimicrobiales bacterium]